MHWLGAGCMTYCAASAVVSGQITTDKDDPSYSEDKVKIRQFLMHNHESVGLVMLAALAPRVAFRLLSKSPKPLPGSALEHLGATVKCPHFQSFGIH